MTWLRCLVLLWVTYETRDSRLRPAPLSRVLKITLRREYSAASDLWAIGVVVFTMICGCAPSRSRACVLGVRSHFLHACRFPPFDGRLPRDELFAHIQVRGLMAWCMLLEC